jgi:hypothetical protein
VGKWGLPPSIKGVEIELGRTHKWGNVNESPIATYQSLLKIQGFYFDNTLTVWL